LKQLPDWRTKGRRKQNEVIDLIRSFAGHREFQNTAIVKPLLRLQAGAFAERSPSSSCKPTLSAKEDKLLSHFEELRASYSHIN
jgi:hypothetical protein